MCNPTAAGAVIALAALCASTLTAQVMILSKGKPKRTPTHTVEVYHGNWWATWHTPRQDRWLMRLGIATLGTAAAMVTASIVATAGCG